VHYRRLAVVLALTTMLTLGWVAATPSTAIPVGIAVSEGASMGPHQIDDIVVYQGLTEPQIGEQVVYYADSRQTYILHRIVDKTPRGYIAQGDALPKTDVQYWNQYVTDKNYAGTVVFRL